VLLQTPLPPPPMIPFDPNQLIPLIGMIVVCRRRDRTVGLLQIGSRIRDCGADSRRHPAQAAWKRVWPGVGRRARRGDGPGVRGGAEHRVTDMQGQLAEMAERLDSRSGCSRKSVSVHCQEHKEHGDH